jgi:hypothetical protein
MKMRGFLSSVTGLALLIAPAKLAAQDEQVDIAQGTAADADPMAEAMGMMSAMFPTEPLTAEQETRLPQAQRIINRMIPEGTLGDMMGGMFDKMLGPILAATDAPAMGAVTKGIGASASAIDLTPEQSAELAALFDPAYVERHEREKALFPAIMRTMMTAMEPTMRKAMSELYAIHFSQTELDDIEAFFQTESGTAYARKSFTMSSDPRIIGATMEAMPQMMGAFADMERKMAEATADLPAPRSFADLSSAQQARVATLTGYSISELTAMASEGEAE